MSPKEASPSGPTLWMFPVYPPHWPSSLPHCSVFRIAPELSSPHSGPSWSLFLFVCVFMSLVSLLVLFRLIGNLWFMPRWLSLNFWNVYASLNKRFVVWYICSVLKLSWSVIIYEVKDEYNELWNLQQPHHEHLKTPHISTDQIVIVVLKTMSDLGFCTNIRIKRRFNYRWRL